MLALLLNCFFVCGIAFGSGNSCNDEIIELSTQGKRTYTLCDKSSADGPTIIWLHCFGCGPRDMLGNEGKSLLDLAHHHGFAVALPHGTGTPPSWNGGPCCGEAKDRGIDDVGFITDLATTLKGQGRGPLLLGGYSNGGFLTALIAQSSSAGMFASFVMLSGHQYDTMAGPGTPIPFMIQHGTEDRLVHYNGCCDKQADGGCCCGITNGKQCIGVESVVHQWSIRNQCDQPAVASAGWSPDSPGVYPGVADTAFEGCMQPTNCARLSIFCKRRRATHFLPNDPGVMESVIIFFKESIKKATSSTGTEGITPPAPTLAAALPAPTLATALPWQLAETAASLPAWVWPAARVVGLVQLVLCLLAFMRSATRRQGARLEHGYAPVPAAAG
jgi:poly(3-hydroxybutyrate) depolymerase